MNSINKKAPGRQQPLNRRAGPAHQFQSVVAQPKTHVTAPDVKRPVAPPVYRPQPVPRVLQTKTVQKLRVEELSQPRRQPVAPPVYRPLPQPKVLQQKKRIVPESMLTVRSPLKNPFSISRSVNVPGSPKPIGPGVDRIANTLGTRTHRSLPFGIIQRAETKPTSFLLVWDPGSQDGEVKDQYLKDDVPKLQKKYGEATVEKPGKSGALPVADVIHILAHGSEQDIAQVTQPKAVAANLFKKFGKSVSGKTVIFYACEVGGGSFLKQVADSLGKDNQRDQVRVIGPINETVTLDGGSTRVLKQRQTEQQARSGQKAYDSGVQKLTAKDERLFPYGKGWVGFESHINQAATPIPVLQVEDIIKANT